MASFLTSLWESIFTPGPTHSLIVATNATFAGLQLILLLLLFATHSVHFVVLSVLCAALWWAINWFVKELKEAQRAEVERVRAEDAEGVGSGGDSTDTETVVEGIGKGGSGKDKERDIRRRVEPLKASGSRSEISTEDEWEKVSENEKDK